MLLWFSGLFLVIGVSGSTGITDLKGCLYAKFCSRALQKLYRSLADRNARVGPFHLTAGFQNTGESRFIVP